MAQVSTQSPHTTPLTGDDVSPEYAFPISNEYAVPGPEEATRDGWWDLVGFSPTLRTSPTGIPDATRLGTIPMYETREGAGVPQDFARQYRDEINQRHSVEDQDADGFERSLNFKRMGARPNPSDTGEPRRTNKMSPRTYSFMRPFDQEMEKRFNGMHFSMADHRREYPVLGMTPPANRRNTYRIEPEPWDTDIVDVPPQVSPTPQARVQVVDIPPPGNRSWRL